MGKSEDIMSPPPCNRSFVRKLKTQPRDGKAQSRELSHGNFAAPPGSRLGSVDPQMDDIPLWNIRTYGFRRLKILAPDDVDFKFVRES